MKNKEQFSRLTVNIQMNAQWMNKKCELNVKRINEK